MPPTTASNSTSRRLPSGQNQPTTDDEVSESAEHQASRIPPRWCPAVSCPESVRRRHGVADTKPASAPFALRQTETPHPPSGCERGAEIRSSGVAASAPYTRHCAEGRFPSRDRSSDRNEQHAAALVHHPANIGCPGGAIRSGVCLPLLIAGLLVRVQLGEQAQSERRSPWEPALTALMVLCRPRRPVRTVAEAVGRIALHFPEHVDIDRARHTDRAVPQQILDRL